MPLIFQKIHKKKKRKPGWGCSSGLILKGQCTWLNTQHGKGRGKKQQQLFRVVHTWNPSTPEAEKLVAHCLGPSPPLPSPPSPIALCEEGEWSSLYSLLSHHGDIDTVGSSHSGKGHPSAHQGWSSLLEGREQRKLLKLMGRHG